MTKLEVIVIQWMHRAILLLSTASFAYSAHAEPAISDDEQEWLFVRQVLLTSEFEPSEMRISRWNEPPKILAYLEENTRSEEIKAAVDKLNRNLSGLGYGTTLTTIPVEDADIVIGIMPQSSMKKVWAAYSCGTFFQHKVAGASCLRIDEAAFSINSALVLVEKDQNDASIESTILEELYQSLGVHNDHQMYPESLTYDGPDRNHHVDLAPIDKKVLIFLYKYLQPGDDEATVRRKFDQYWHMIEVD